MAGPSVSLSLYSLTYLPELTSLLAGILLLLTRFLLAAALLLTGLLARILVLLARVLAAHSGSPLLNATPDQPSRRLLVAKGTQFRRGFNVAADCRDRGPRNRGGTAEELSRNAAEPITETILYKPIG